MKQFFVKIEVMLKEGILDPQGKTVKRALHSIGFEDVQNVRIGKMIHVTVSSESEDQAKERIEDMAKRVLANPIIERFSIEKIEEIV